jgi:hypothetical protein
MFRLVYQAAHFFPDWRGRIQLKPMLEANVA